MDWIAALYATGALAGLGVAVGAIIAWVWLCISIGERFGWPFIAEIALCLAPSVIGAWAFVYVAAAS